MHQRRGGWRRCGASTWLATAAGDLGWQSGRPEVIWRERRQRNVEGAGEQVGRRERWYVSAALKVRDVGTVVSSTLAELLLAEAGGLAVVLELLAEGDGE
ncbi:hypothetical protein GCM10007977_081110 [Dactylosporangium sucinum]|uniref:Uncharacterized protein n=1 Tax=Dactylosporangium sucinum TaxID=1424081 RepID=A0A917UAW4_9ACTN|nr:hypothetical protein GCM10007977_081110 [Dactylosporangium sucinum]